MFEFAALDAGGKEICTKVTKYRGTKRFILRTLTLENQRTSASPQRLHTAVVRFCSPNWVLPAAIGLTALFRFCLILWTGHRQHFYDESEYWGIAQSIVHGKGYSLFGHLTAYRPPAIPYLLALGMKLVGPRYWVFAFANATLLCLLPWLVFRTAQYLQVSKPYAVLAGVLVAFHPGLNYAAITIYPTTLTAVALVLASLLALMAMRRHSTAYGSLAGLAAGIAGAATTVFIPFGIVLGMAAAWRRSWRVAVCITVLSLLPAVAWVARNHVDVHTNAVATNGGFNMELGANDQAEPRSGNLIRPEIVPEEPTGGEVDWDRDHHRRAQAWIAAHRGRYAELVILRSLAVFDSVGRPATAGLHTSMFAQAIGWAMLPIVLLGLFGLWLERRRPLAWITAGALALVMVSSGLTIVKPRFRFPCDPLLMIFSVAALAFTINGREPEEIVGGQS